MTSDKKRPRRSRPHPALVPPGSLRALLGFSTPGLTPLRGNGGTRPRRAEGAVPVCAGPGPGWRGTAGPAFYTARMAQVWESKGPKEQL